jgi:PAS domain S-box-containing protein
VKATRSKKLRKPNSAEKLQKKTPDTWATQYRDELELQNEGLAQSQLELELSRERYADLFDAAPVCFVTLTRSGIVREANLPAAQFLRQSRAHLLGHPFLLFVAKNDRRKFLHHLVLCRQNLEQTRPLSVELELEQKSGENPVFIELISTPAIGPKSELNVYKSIFLGITERKRYEQELKRARDEAERASRAKDDFLAALSHELRTPLNPVLLIASDAAADYELPPDIRANFDTIRRNVELEARLIDDLLDLTRITREKLQLEKRIVSGHAILKEAISVVQSEAEQKEIAIEQKFGAHQDSVFGDAVRLQQIFWNVLKNAAKFTPAKGAIFIETGISEKQEFFVSVSDTGIGMNADELSRVFDAFAQGEHVKQGGAHRFGGLGLGLAISRKLVELHSGSIEAFSDGHNCGSKFTMRFPLAKSSEQIEVAEKRLPAASLQPAAKKSGIHILLVEDHEPTRTALAKLLICRHHQVETAASMKEAKTIATKSRFDLLISDIGLPDGSGYDLLNDLQKCSPIKGIALTGYGMDEDVARSEAVGFTAHLTKPVRVQSLEDALTKAQFD